jgi:hypothetical protein
MCVRGSVGPAMSNSSSNCVATRGWEIRTAGAAPARCGLGFYKDSVGNTTCTACQVGLNTTSLATTSSSNCQADQGWEVTTAGAAPAQCGFGFYKASMGNTTCTACQTGLNTTSLGSTNSSDCQADKGWEIVGAALTQCGFGSYKDSVGNTTCTACQTGLNTTSLGSSSSSNCEANQGWEILTPGAAPVQCGYGFYKPLPASNTTCTACLDGKNTTSLGATSGDAW